MNKKTQDSGVGVSLWLLFALAATAMAQSTGDPFKQAVAQYQQSPIPANAEAAIKLALNMKPAPAIPEEAEKFMARGQAAVEAAKEPTDFKAAAAEFEKAVLAAPWVANAYYNLGVVQDKAGDCTGAIRNLNLYLLAAPNAGDTRAVKSLIYKIEFKQEKMMKDAAAAAKKVAEEEARRSAQGLAGRWIWHSDKWQANVYKGYQIAVDGNQITVAWTEYSGESVVNMSGKHSFKGTMNGRELDGTYSIDRSMWQGGKVFTYPFRGTISEDGNEIRLKYRTIDITGATGLRPDGWREWDEEAVLKRQ